MKTAATNGKPRHISGWKPDLPDHRDFKMAVSRAAPRPTSKDLRSICSKVEDQESIGSCTANSSTSMMESLYNKVQANSAPQLSRLFLYYSTRVWVERGAPNDDSGCYIRDVLKAMAKYGVCLENLWKYDNSSVRFSLEPNPTAKADALNHQILSYIRCPSLSAILQCLADGYTCVGGFSVPENMMSPDCERTGIVKLPGRREAIVGGHAVHFTGYDDTKRLLTFQNSWSTSWGDQGFGYLPYGFVTRGLADDFWSVRTEEMPAASTSARKPKSQPQ